MEKAFEYLRSYSDTMERDVRFSVQCGPEGTKGIHMRSGIQDKPKEWSIRIKPEFFDDSGLHLLIIFTKPKTFIDLCINISNAFSEPEEKVKFNIKLALLCSEPWVQTPSHLDLVNSPRTITVRIDPTSLPEGVHSTRYGRGDLLFTFQLVKA